MPPKYKVGDVIQLEFTPIDIRNMSIVKKVINGSYTIFGVTTGRTRTSEISWIDGIYTLSEMTEEMVNILYAKV